MKLHLNLLLTLVAVLGAACGQKFPPDSPEYVVQGLYKAAAKTGIPKDQATLSKYFDLRLTGLLVKDFSCVSDGEPCGLYYFDPVAQSKEPDITNLEIMKSPDDNDVFVSFEQSNARYKAMCVMVRTTAGWRISDIIYSGANDILDPGTSLVTTLALQIKPPAPWHPPVPGMPHGMSEQSL